MHPRNPNGRGVAAENDLYSVAISIAAAAASRPLLSGPSPARAVACSIVFVVKTPKAIGTPVSPAAAAIPCAAADAM